MAQVFDTGGTIDAIYGTSGGNTITFSNLQNGTSSYTLQNGYLIDGYSIGWQRSIQLKRVFNRNNRVAIVRIRQSRRGCRIRTRTAESERSDRSRRRLRTADGRDFR